MTLWAARHSSSRSVVVVLVEPSGAVCARRARFRERVAAHLAPERLDLELAAGASPESRPDLALRARSLASPRSRQVLAGSVRRLLRRVDDPVSALPTYPTLALLDRVEESRHELDLLLERLLAPAPLPTRGLALVHLLLSDSAGPLYRRGAHEDLAATVMHAVRALDPAEDWPG
ncbi:MAG: hypothetical protein WAN48_04865 [Actinomycetes bacterium]